MSFKQPVFLPAMRLQGILFVSLASFLTVRLLSRCERCLVHVAASVRAFLVSSPPSHSIIGITGPTVGCCGMQCAKLDCLLESWLDTGTCSGGLG